MVKKVVVNKQTTSLATRIEEPLDLVNRWALSFMKSREVTNVIFVVHAQKFVVVTMREIVIDAETAGLTGLPPSSWPTSRCLVRSLTSS
jgi:hypothetical protein